VELFEFKFDSSMHFAVVEKSLPYKMQLGVKSRIFAEISLLHDAAGSFDSQAAFNSRESNLPVA
jgi:hypothetical protein